MGRYYAAFKNLIHKEVIILNKRLFEKGLKLFSGLFVLCYSEKYLN